MSKSEKVTKSNTIKWEAEEYVQHNKNVGWYIGLVVIALALCALAVLVKWWTFLALVVLSAISLILYSVRPPRKIKYTLSNSGLKEGEKTYNFADFKAFGVLQDDAHFAIVLRPRKRFSPSVTIYFPANQGEEIVDFFGARFPMEDVKLDLLDKLVRLLRI
ncbi:MAG: hypothetical protein Q4E47_02975 [Candidatus Saccharibacteria bacterium]|nr:hypothetical protein [Candidatus Saccharibacteria bacterium]